MPTNPDPLQFGSFYHIYNRGNNRENVFIQQRNYAYFMDLWWKHTYRIAETYSYCLLKNHFHATGYIKAKEDISVEGNIREPSQYFANFFNAYTRGVNNATGRSGMLFETPFKRIPVTNEKYLMQLIVYIHQNPQKHKFVEDFRDWNFLSYHDLIGNNPTRLQREKVLNLFGSRDDFIRIHQEIQPLVGFDEEED